MKNNTSSKPTKLLSALGALAMVTSLSLTASAEHIDASGGPTQVEYPGYLMVQYAGVNYRTSSSSPCTGVSGSTMDTVKMWMSLAQAALLSGKNMRIYFNSCVSGGVTTRYISDLVLIK